MTLCVFISRMLRVLRLVQLYCCWTRCTLCMIKPCLFSAQIQWWECFSCCIQYDELGYSTLKITNRFPNFSGCTVEAWEWISNFTPHFMDVIIYSCCGLKLFYVSKGGPGGYWTNKTIADSIHWRLKPIKIWVQVVSGLATHGRLYFTLAC